MSCDRFRSFDTRISSLAAVGAVLALAAPASAATWGSGTFTGKAKSAVGADRPRTAVTIVVKGAKVRVKVLKMRFRCDDASRRTPVRVSTRFVPVKPGAAGGGAMIELDRRVRVHDESLRLDGTVFLGLRATSVSGTADAYLLDDRGSAVCEDAAIFTAR